MPVDIVQSSEEDGSSQQHGTDAGLPDAMVYFPARRGFLAEFNILVCHYAYALSVGEDAFLDDSRAAVFWLDIFEPCLRFRSELIEQNYGRVTLCGSKVAPEAWNSRRRWVQRACNDDDVVNIPALDFQGTWKDLLFDVTKRLFLPIPEIRAKAAECLIALGLEPGAFGAIHIRRGDKTDGYMAANGTLRVEGEAIDLDLYIAALKNTAPEIKRIFIMTDDYREVVDARRRYPSLDFATLCEPTEEGYRNHDFRGLTHKERVSAIRRLVTEMLISTHSAAFAGAYLSNVSRTVAALHPIPTACCSVDTQVRWIAMP